MKKYKVRHYDRFYKPGYDYKGTFFFETLEEAEKFIAHHEESKKKWPELFDKHEYVLEITK